MLRCKIAFFNPACDACTDVHARKIFSNPINQTKKNKIKPKVF